jgi:preprotein translocase subunit SecG
MFILSLFSVFYGILCLFIVLLVLIQRGKGNMGLGNMGGGNQAIFGSSGGQDIFQKITWFCLTLLLGGSLILCVLRGKEGAGSYQTRNPRQSIPMPSSQDQFPDEI